MYSYSNNYTYACISQYIVLLFLEESFNSEAYYPNDDRSLNDRKKGQDQGWISRFLKANSVATNSVAWFT